MLKKEKRLSRSEINSLKSSSSQKKIIQGRFFGLIYQGNQLHGKFGLILSKKIASKATERNRIKRLLYCAIEDTLEKGKGYFLFLAKKCSVNGSEEEFKKELEIFKNKLIT